ncbi:non-heme ferritin [Gallibacterium anatis]|uniref:non-heme ferritin n=1 Tax=Gallibacterium anatis TaxID=750 RepID=UPI00254BA3E9|nr:non-heme ferritin [Gallibacterium anatis]WIM82896.1 non-heme ferritin [Gallibacterium anatis]
MLKPAMIEKLNQQINLEFYSSNLYLQMSAWCNEHGYEGAAAFLLRHADEELQHMQKLFAYVSETGALPILGEIAAPQHEFSSLKQLFTLVLEHEQLITQKINQLVDESFVEKDYSTFNFLQWYVSEQHEEETLFKRILSKFDLAGEDQRGLYFVDKELASL